VKFVTEQDLLIAEEVMAGLGEPEKVRLILGCVRIMTMLKGDIWLAPLGAVV
jgi:hypothetical protein